MFMLEIADEQNFLIAKIAEEFNEYECSCLLIKKMNMSSFVILSNFINC